MNNSEVTPAQNLKVGVIGLGWAGQQHVAAYQNIEGVEVVALSGQEADLLAKLGAQHGISQLLPNWQELVALPELDAISVAVPTFLHAPIAIAALDRGLHVLSEKPVARDGAEGQLMVDAARRAGRVLDVAFNHRRRGDIQALKRILDSGELGQPYYAKASWLRRSGIPRLGSWFTNKHMAGGGPLIDLGVHVLDYALCLLGEPRVLSVSAAAFAELGPRGRGGDLRPTADTTASAFEVEDLATAFLRLEGGGVLALEAGWAAYRESEDLMDIQVFATEGGAALKIVGATENPAAEIRIFTDKDGVNADRVVETDAGRGHQQVIDEFVEIIRGDSAEWSKHDGSLAVSRARIIDACYESAQKNVEVQL